MRPFTMHWHKTKMNLIKNRYLILFSAGLALWVFSFVLGFLLLSRFAEIIERIEDNQKGNVCILLLTREQRTQENVTECIDKNKTIKKPTDKFKFNPPDDPNDSALSSFTPPINASLPTSSDNIQVTNSAPPSVQPKKPIAVNEPANEPPVLTKPLPDPVKIVPDVLKIETEVSP